MTQTYNIFLVCTHNKEEPVLHIYVCLYYKEKVHHAHLCGGSPRSDIFNKVFLVIVCAVSVLHFSCRKLSGCCPFLCQNPDTKYHGNITCLVITGSPKIFSVVLAIYMAFLSSSLIIWLHFPFSSSEYRC